MKHGSAVIVIASIFLFGATFVAMATKLPVSVSNPILTVSGAIANTNMGDKAVLDFETLNSMPKTSFETGTIWFNGKMKFEGVSLKDFVEIIGAQGSVLDVTALNDYSVEIPISDAVDGGPVLAYLIDGESIAVREKGPIWLIYPFDQNIDYRSQVYYARSIWQVSRINVRD